ncbi:hypothetical protein [Pseudomonas aeruginosa]|uniref:hypothetical protein n=1 Tax=Pseudomonas aeruginosa TaxID=287 RepID=UPI002E27B080|nr:hypothetical protein [Pseudomonas aeruginosa]HBO5288279.1 hypothetical protein [Pseudomonas aeruginosa]HCG1236141.1 hypothetical protein [Pseudomonas aeruginosa]
MPNDLLQRIENLPPEQAVEKLFGITAEELRTVATQCYRMAAAAGPLQPKGSGGTLAWIYGTEALRAVTIPKGWKPADPSNQPRVVSPDNKHAVTVICGDSNTGDPHAVPLTRNKRGSRTTRSVYYNAAQTDMFPVDRRDRQRIPLDAATEQTLWILLFHADVENQVIHYELSRPVNMGENGKVDGWQPRFIMPPLNLNAPDDFDGPDSSPTIDIPVTPRS